MKKYFAFAAMALTLVGCETLPPLMAPSVSGSCSSATGRHKKLCDQVNEINDRAKLYAERSERLNGGSQALQSAVVLSTLTSAGLAIFGGSPNAIAGTAFGSGVGTTFDSNLRLSDQYDILQDGRDALICLSGVGVGFADIYEPSTINPARTTLQLLQTTKSELDKEIVDAEQHVSMVATGPLRGELNTLIVRAKEEYDTLVRLETAVSVFNTQLGDAFRASDKTTRDRLKGSRPDITALVEQIRALAEMNQQEAVPTDQSGGMTMMALAGGTTTDADFIRDLQSLMKDAAYINADHYLALQEKIPMCQATATT